MTHCPCDLNNDGIVDDADWAIFMVAWGSKVGDENWNEACDFDNNGIVNIVDATIFEKNRGPCMETRTLALTEGPHDIQISLLPDYEILEATINVSSAGVTCVSVVDGACGGTGLPRVSTSAFTVTTYLKTGAVSTERCTWVATKDTSKVVFISEMVLAYNDLLNIGFAPTAAEIGNAVLMYSNLGTPASLWGC